MSFTVDFYVGKGIDEYIDRLDQLKDRTEAMITATIDPGAKIVADEVKKEIYALPVEDREQRNFKQSAKSKSGNRKSTSHKTPSKKRTGVLQVEKDGLIESMGLAPVRDDNGFINRKLGFDGYNNHITNKYPKGHPNVVVARALESGTSFMQKNAFVSRAAARVWRDAEDAMKKQFEIELQQAMK